MIDNANQASPQDDEPILCVRYTTDLGWFVRIATLVLGFLLLYGVHLFLLREDYLRAFIVAVAALIGLAAGIESLSTKDILFYRNRISKTWYFQRHRTIPYARAKLKVAPAYMRKAPGWGTASKTFWVVEIDDKGRDTVLQVPIAYCFLCVAPSVRKQVAAALIYLLDLKEGADIYESNGLFAKASLPKEAICQKDCPSKYL